MPPIKKRARPSKQRQQRSHQLHAQAPPQSCPSLPDHSHTKFVPDRCFGLIKQRFKKTRVSTLSETAGVVKDSTVTGVNIPQLVGLEDGTMLVERYGWQQHLTPYFRPLPQINQYQHFRLSPRSVQTVGTRFKLLHNADILPPIDGLPVHAPPGLDTARQTCIFEASRVAQWLRALYCSASWVHAQALS